MSDTQQRKISGLTVTIERDSCIGSGSCRNVAPDVFDFDATQIITFAEGAPEDADRDRVIEACQVCPVEALVVDDESGTRIVP